MSVKQLPQTLFGVGQAEKYLVDTLNKLQRKKITAKCMAMISASRAWASKFSALMRSDIISAQEVGNLVRLFKAEQARHYASLNKSLDEDMAAWSPELKPEALEAKRLEGLALKLAMNISTAAMKEVGSYVMRVRTDQIRKETQLRAARRSWQELVTSENDGQEIGLSNLKLSLEQELEVMKIVRAALRKPT